MDAGNRVLWTIIGVVLLAAGALGVVAWAGWLPGTETDSPLLWSALIEQWQDWEPWVWVAVAAVGVIVALLGLWLIGGQLQRSGGPAMTDLEIDAPDGRGRTVLGRSTLTHATQQDLEHIPGVQNAAIRLLSNHGGPEVRARLEVGSDASLSAVATDFRESLSRFTATSGLGPEAVDVTVRVGASTARRVS